VQRLEDQLARAAGQPLDPLRQVDDRHRRARIADVERVADRLRQLEAEQHRLDHVLDVAPRPDLRPVAVNDEVAACERGLDERADRAAADLARAVDVERVHGHRRDAELLVVGVRHVLAGELRHGVRPARLADAADRRDLALADVERVRSEHLAGREVDEALERVRRRERGLERVVGAHDVDAHRAHRALANRVDAGDRGAMDDVRRPAGERGDRIEVEHVGLVEGEVRVVRERRARERVAVQVVERDDLVPVDELTRERRRDEARAAGDEDPLVLQHAPSLPRRAPDRRRSRRAEPGSAAARPAGGTMPSGPVFAHCALRPRLPAGRQERGG
jgi:hypothetical protein